MTAPVPEAVKIVRAAIQEAQKAGASSVEVNPKTGKVVVSFAVKDRVAGIDEVDFR